MVQGRTSAKWAAFRTQPSLPVNTNVLSLEPLILVKGKRGSCSTLAQITGEVKRQAVVACNSGQSLPVLIACHFKGNHYLLLSDAGLTETACKQFQGGISGLPPTFPVNCSGPEPERALNKTQATFPPMYLSCTLHLTGPQAHGMRKKGVPQTGKTRDSWVQLRSGTRMRTSWH